ncbi:hypothetical protein BDY19DRAFT_901411 [Irpex rosettiformis]|uniref:Uncharacterized protein n=1 Tax=Irpex rosettiformis TaxID=378272 RepID=A0ACB8UIR8_9APHY|nr:hypothetical protein BDY19DRAFT_901411 [Irpex rosettiformis]
MLTALDQTSGSVIVMLHIDSNMTPGVPLSVETIKLNVYFTPFILEDISDGEVAIARLTQMFAECIVLPTVQQWEQGMARIGVKLGQRIISGTSRQSHLKFYNYDDPPPLIPSSILPNCSIYRIPGRPVGAVERAIEYFHPRVVDNTPRAQSNSKQHASDIDNDNNITERSMSSFIDLQTMYEGLRAEYKELHQWFVRSQARTAYLEKQLDR